MTTDLGDLAIQHVPVGEIDPHPENANRGDLDAIKESIRINGYYAPILVQSSTGYILAGNHRYRAATELGHQQVPVIYLDVDDEAAKRIMVADNRTTRLGSDDDALLASLLAEIGEGETGLLGTGYTHADLQTLLDAQDKFSDDLIGEPDPEPDGWGNAPEENYNIEPIAGPGGTATGILITHPHHEKWTAADYNRVRVLLGLSPAPRGALATLGIEDWA